MTRWLISVPVWGERWVDEFCATTLPPLDRALACLAAEHGVDARLVVCTDQPGRVRAGGACAMEFRDVPAGSRYFDCMSQAHREALRLALCGDVVVLMTGRSVISKRGLAYCADRLAEDDRLRVILCAAPRVLAAGPLPDTSDAQVLMDWAWDNRHPMTRDCTWPDGRSVDLSRTYFVAQDARGVVTRQALPHPLAVRIDGRCLRFTPTVDANLIHCFDPYEMHVATDCRELALVKLTAGDRAHDLALDTMAERAVSGHLVIADPLQRWCLGHRIVLTGDGIAVRGDYEFIASVRGG